MSIIKQNIFLEWILRRAAARPPSFTSTQGTDKLEFSPIDRPGQVCFPRPLRLEFILYFPHSILPVREGGRVRVRGRARAIFRERALARERWPCPVGSPRQGDALRQV